MNEPAGQAMLRRRKACQQGRDGAGGGARKYGGEAPRTVLENRAVLPVTLEKSVAKPIDDQKNDWPAAFRSESANLEWKLGPAQPGAEVPRKAEETTTIKIWQDGTVWQLKGGMQHRIGLQMQKTGQV